MHNVLQILRRDFKRLVTVPAAWVIMIGLILIPPLYAWFNIYGFWNPYGNTDSIKVAVANMDEGTDNALLGKVNLGDQIEGTLKSNDQLGWEFMGKANAMEAVESGDCYAAIVIPSDFSEDLANVVTNDFSINMREVNIQSHDGIFEGTLSLYVRDAESLNALLERLRRIKGMETVKRVLN